MKNLENKTTNELQTIMNNCYAIIETRKRVEITSNTQILITEICNLIDGCGEGYTEADYYANERYYSEAKGVKNIRFYNDSVLEVKLLSKTTLPNEIEVRGETYKVKEVFSKNYSKTM